MERMTERYTPELVYLVGNGQTYNTRSRSKMAKALDRLAAYEDTGLEPDEIKYRLDAVTAAVDAALSVINEFAAEMDYCVYSCIYQAVEAIGEEANHGTTDN